VASKKDLEEAKKKNEIFNVGNKPTETEQSAAEDDVLINTSVNKLANQSVNKLANKLANKLVSDESSSSKSTIKEEEAFMDRYKTKKKPKRSLRGLYFDPDIDEALERMKNTGIELSRFVNDVIRENIPKKFLD